MDHVHVCMLVRVVFHQGCVGLAGVVSPSLSEPVLYICIC